MRRPNHRSGQLCARGRRLHHRPEGPSASGQPLVLQLEPCNAPQMLVSGGRRPEGSPGRVARTAVILATFGTWGGLNTGASHPLALVPYWVWNARMLKVAVITRQSCGL